MERILSVGEVNGWVKETFCMSKRIVDKIDLCVIGTGCTRNFIEGKVSQSNDSGKVLIRSTLWYRSN